MAIEIDLPIYLFQMVIFNSYIRFCQWEFQDPKMEILYQKLSHLYLN